MTRWNPLMVRLPLEMETHLRVLCDLDERPLAWMIRKAISEYLQRQDPYWRWCGYCLAEFTEDCERSMECVEADEREKERR
jgi:hypothetical protein